MARRKSKNEGITAIGASISEWVSALDRVERARILKIAATVAGVGIALALAFAGLGRVESRVHALPRYDRPLTLDWPGMPAWCNGEIREELTARVGLGLQDQLLDPKLAERIGQRLSDPSVGWIKRVDRVQVRPDGNIAIDCLYRQPRAWVRDGKRCYLVDDEAVLLPNSYSPGDTKDSGLFTIVGVSQSRPASAGTAWPGADLAAALKIIRLLEGRAFSSQITAVDVENYNGRKSPTTSHIELITDKPGSRIRWGRGPDEEFGTEIAARQKIVLLEALHRHNGRVDLGQSYVDITTGTNIARVPKSSTTKSAPLRG